MKSRHYSILFIFLLLLISLLSVVEAKHKSKGVKMPKIKKSHKSHKAHKAHKSHKAHKGHKKAQKKSHKHVHHAGIQHSTPQIVKPMPPPLIQSSIPAALYSPPFEGLETGQIPNDDQVALILDWLSKIGSTIDVYLRLQGTYPDGSKDQRNLVKNVYPPLRVLLEAQHSYDFKSTNKQ